MWFFHHRFWPAYRRLKIYRWHFVPPSFNSGASASASSSSSSQHPHHPHHSYTWPHHSFYHNAYPYRHRRWGPIIAAGIAGAIAYRWWSGRPQVHAPSTSFPPPSPPSPSLPLSDNVVTHSSSSSPPPSFSSSSSSITEDTDYGVSRVGSFKSSGILFKDTVQVDGFSDPAISGVTLFISTVDQPILGFLRDSSAASLAVVQTGPITLRAPINQSPEGEEVFSERRNVLFKELHVRRIWDAKRQTLVYVAYSTRLWQNQQESHNRYKTSIACVSLRDLEAHQPLLLQQPANLVPSSPASSASAPPSSTSFSTTPSSSSLPLRQIE